MNKKTIPIKLSTQFTLAALGSVFIAVMVFLLISYCGAGVIKAKVQNSDYVEQSIAKKVNEFQTYVSNNHISVYDTDSVSAWVRKERNVMLAIHDNGKVIFDSTHAWRKNHSIEDEPPPHSYRTLYSIQFADKEAYIECFVLIEFKFIVAVNYMAIFIAIAVFLLVFTSFIRRKVQYITKLEKEVNILEGGDLSYKLTVKGDDELTYLANSIDNMRLSIIERQKEEEQARLANHKLVTAMSHDLRTPLTILIGLIEIIDGKKYKTEQELETYITKTKNKAYQIKELSDKIFEYFFAFDIKESELDKEPYGTDVINTMIEDYVFSLSENGYIFDCSLCDAPVSVMLDTNVFGRVFGNIFSNILKYADKSKPIIIKSRIDNDRLVINVSNSVIGNVHTEESTNIGLEVCRNILKQHNGSFENTENGSEFSVQLVLPVIRQN